MRVVVRQGFYCIWNGGIRLCLHDPVGSICMRIFFSQKFHPAQLFNYLRKLPGASHFVIFFVGKINFKVGKSTLKLVNQL